jgi:mannosyltransferase
VTRDPVAEGAPAGGRRAGLVPSTDDNRVAIVIVILISLVLRMWQVGRLSLWTDEGTAWTAASLPFRQLVTFCATKDASPPLYYLLAGWALRLGDNEAALRLVSVLASTALVWVTYRLARLFADRRTSTVAAALTALSPYQIMYAQEARTYALVALWTVLGLWLFARAVLLERPRAFVPLAVVTALGLWTQAISVLGLGVQAAFVVLTPAGRRNAGRWALAMGAAALAYVPWLLVGGGGTELGNSHWYLRSPGAHDSFQVLRSVFLSPISLVTPPIGATLPGLEQFIPRALAWGLLVVIPFLPLGGALAVAGDRDERGLLTRFTIGALILPLITVWAVSFHRPLWLPRYFVFLTPMVAVLSATGLRALLSRPLAMVWFALLLLATGYGTFRYYTDYTKEPWRRAVEVIAARSDPADTRVIVTFDPDPFEFYNRRLPRPFAWAAAAHPDVPFHDAFTRAQLAEIDDTLRARTAGAEDVWVVVRSPNSEVRRQIAASALAIASAGRMRTDFDSLGSVQGPLRLTRFVRVPSGTAMPAHAGAGDTLSAAP